MDFISTEEKSVHILQIDEPNFVSRFLFFQKTYLWKRVKRIKWLRISFSTYLKVDKRVYIAINQFKRSRNGIHTTVRWTCLDSSLNHLSGIYRAIIVCKMYAQLFFKAKIVVWLSLLWDKYRFISLCSAFIIVSLNHWPCSIIIVSEFVIFNTLFQKWTVEVLWNFELTTTILFPLSSLNVVCTFS